MSRDYLLDYGSTYGAGTATHKLTLYKRASGALGVRRRDLSSGPGAWMRTTTAAIWARPTDVRMQQATVNLFADMGVQPATLQAGLARGRGLDRCDRARPRPSPRRPPARSSPPGQAVTITGTATDTGGGVVGGVEVSVDGGTTWHPASGRASWSYSWTPSASGSVTIKSRAVDDSGNLETPGAGVTVTVGSATRTPCTALHHLAEHGDARATQRTPIPSAVELGVKFRADVNGSITGIRFYKSEHQHRHAYRQPVDQHRDAAGVGDVHQRDALGLAAGQLRHAGGDHRQHRLRGLLPRHHRPLLPTTSGYFATAGVDNPPLHALRDGVSGGNGVYVYGASSAFPTNTFQSTNYWVDVVFSAAAPPTATATATATPVATATSTPVATATSTPVATATSTLSRPRRRPPSRPRPTSTPVATATSTPVATATSTPVATATSTPVATATSTPVATATTTAVATATATPIETATATPVETATATPVAPATETETAAPVATATATETLTATPTVTAAETLDRKRDRDVDPRRDRDDDTSRNGNGNTDRDGDGDTG